MSSRSPRLLALAGLVAIGVSAAHASGFNDFAEDEDVCRRVGAEAVAGATGPSAAHRYDFSYRRCMSAHLRSRQMGAYAQGGPDGAVGNPHSFEFPDAFYRIPYATPGYGYDGFSY